MCRLLKKVSGSRNEDWRNPFVMHFIDSLSNDKEKVKSRMQPSVCGESSGGVSLEDWGSNRRGGRSWTERRYKGHSEEMWPLWLRGRWDRAWMGRDAGAPDDRAELR